MDGAQQSLNVPVTHSTVTAQFVMPWLMGAAWTPKCEGDKSKFVEWIVEFVE